LNKLFARVKGWRAARKLMHVVMRVGGMRAPQNIHEKSDTQEDQETAADGRDSGPRKVASSKSVEKVCGALRVSVATYQRWNSNYGEAKRVALTRSLEWEKGNP
jgi:hypothetical protein